MGRLRSVVPIPYVEVSVQMIKSFHVKYSGVASCQSYRSNEILYYCFITAM